MYRTLFEAVYSRPCGLRLASDDPIVDFSAARHVLLIRKTSIEETIIAAATVRSLPRPGDLEVGLFGVDKKQKKGGLGRRLFEEGVLPFARAGGATRLVTHANINNGANEFWRKMGFKTAPGPVGGLNSPVTEAMVYDLL